MMLRNNYLRAGCLFFFSLTLSAAENSTLVLNFGGSPGDKIPHSYDYGTPEDAGDFYTMRIPIIYEDLAAVFYDTEVTVRSADKKVMRVSAERAYKSLSDCNEGLAVVKEKLAKGLPRDYAGTAEHWQYQAPGGDVLGRVACSKERRRPFFTIDLVIELAE